MPVAGLGAPGGVPIRIRTGISPAILAFLLKTIMVSNPGDPKAQALLVEARKLKADFDPNLVLPDRFTSFLDVVNTFGDLTFILGELQKFKRLHLTPPFITSLYLEAQEDIDITRAAARLAKLPERELKYINVSYLPRIIRDNLTQLEDAKQGASAADIGRLNVRIKRITDRSTRFVPVTPPEEIEFNRLDTAVQACRMHLSHIQSERITAKNHLSGQSLVRRLAVLKTEEMRHRRELRRHESRLKRMERSKVDLYESHLRLTDDIDALEEGKAVEKANLARKRNGPTLVAAYERTEREENALLSEAYRLRANVPDKHLHFGPRHKLQFVNDGKEAAIVQESDLENAVYDRISNPDGTIDPKKFHALDRKGLQRASSRWQSMQAIERNLAESIKFELDKANPAGDGTTVNETIATQIAHALAPRLADIHRVVLEKRGEGAAAKMKYNPAFIPPVRETALRITMKTLLDLDPSITTKSDAEIVANAWLDTVISEGLRYSANTPACRIRYKLSRSSLTLNKDLRRKIPRGSHVLVREKTEFVPDHLGHAMIKKRETQTAIANSVEDIAEGFSRFYRLRKDISNFGRQIDVLIYGEEELEGKLKRDTFEVREAKRVAFMQGVFAAKRQLEQDPLGAIPIVVGNTIYTSLAPISLQRSTIATRTGLIGLGLYTYLGPGALPLAATGAFVHADKWYKKEWEDRYAPVLHTDEWARNFAKGKIYELAKLNPLATYDERGNLDITGAGKVVDGWNFLWKSLGAVIGNSYQKSFLDLQALHGKRAAKDMARKSFGLNVKLLISERLKDDRKRTNPISLIFGIGWAVVKGGILTALETSGALPTFRHFLKYNGGDLWKDLRFGAGYSNSVRIAEIRKELIDDLAVTPGSPGYADEISRIDRKLNRLKTFGTILKRGSSIWQGFKIGVEGVARGAVVTTVAFLFDMSFPAALAVGAGYTIPWTIRSVLTNPMFGGFFEIGGGYHPGLINPNSSWGRFARVLNTPLDEFADLRKYVGAGQRWAGGIAKFIPWDGIWIGTALFSLGLPWPVAFGIPIGLDLGVRAFSQLTKLSAVSKFFAATGPWAQFTGGLSVVFNIGSLSFALEHGGFSGLFDVFRELNLENVLKFSTIPSTYLSFLGLFGALGISGSILGMPLFIAAGVFTGAVIITDQLLRAFGVEYGLWTIFKKPLEGLWNFIKNKGWGVATSAFAAITGLFGAFTAAMKGDIQGMAISIVMMLVGGYTFAIAYGATTPIPSTYYTPKEGKEVKGNLYIRSASKNFVGLNDPDNDELTYEYYFYTSSSDTISSLNLTETDTFSGIDPDSISLLKTLPIGTTFGIDKDGDNFIISHSADDYKPASKFTREFTIGLPDKLENLLSDDEELCNTLVIEINNIVKNDGTEEVPQEENILQKVCIDREGNVTEMFSHLPIDPGKGAISSCYECRKLPSEKKESLHEGIDIATSIGTPVYAIGSGTVEKAENKGGFGNYVKINHGENTFSYYAHMIEFYVNTGDHIQGGEQIGAVGKTGYSIGPHLHFQIDINGESVNPCLMINMCEHVYKGATCDSIPENKSDPTIDCL